MKKVISALVAAATFIVCAETTDDPISAKAAEIAAKAAEAAKANTNKMTRAQLEQRPQVLEKTGGFIDVAAVGTSVVVIDARATPRGSADQFSEVFANLSKTNVKVEKTPLGDRCAIELAKERLLGEKAGYAIVVYESEKTSGLTVLPEERIVAVNAAKYKGGDDPLKDEIRVHKEIWRGLGFVAGLGYAPFKNDVLQPVFSVAELDRLEYQVMQPLNFQKMYTALGSFGIKRSRHIPYLTAVHEGWAPTPTNDYQRAVWNRVRAEKERGPANALQIKP